MGNDFELLQCNLCLHLKVSQRRRASARACVRRAENGPPGAFAICCVEQHCQAKTCVEVSIFESF